MSRFAIVVRNGQVVTPSGVVRADVAVAEGKFAAIAPCVSGAAAVEIDATGCHVFPGAIDAHVHFNEPGRTEWEGLETGSAALAAGGGTCFFDMPLNSEPPVLDAARLREKRALAEAKSCTDFALWGGLTPLNLDRLGELREAGAIGLKAFMSDSGIESFPRVDASTLRAGMQRAAELRWRVAVHAEDEALAARYTAEQRARGTGGAAAWLASRPVEVELAAIRLATELAGETGCALHVVHVSSPEGVALVKAARARGVDVTAETCPHYLLLNAGDVARIGAPAKCAPPIRDEARRIGLWAEVRAGRIHTIGSDHSPAPAGMKQSANFFENWGGIAGGQHGLPLLLSESAATAAADWPVLAAALAHNVAARFALAGKGAIAEGYDADFALIRLGEEREIRADDLLTRHAISPYVGRRCRTRVTHTFVRGRAVVAEGRLTSPRPRGQFVAPTR